MKENTPYTHIPKHLFDMLKDTSEKKEFEVTKTNIVDTIASMFFATREKEEVDEIRLKANPLSKEEIDKTISNPDSPYNKLIKGYVYHVELSTVITTGCGGAQFMYKMMLGEGMTEPMIEQIIYVSLEPNSDVAYPLAALKVKEIEEQS